MSPAEERLQALVDKWVTSLEAHLRYAALTDEAYWKVQAWTPHERPSRWIIELALSRARELHREVAARRETGDESFAAALELMGFLSNLVGAEHIARFIPLADPAHELQSVPAPPPAAVAPVAAPATAGSPPTLISLLDDPHATTPQPPALEVTREMPSPAIGVDTSATRDMPRPALTADTSATRQMPRPGTRRDSAATRSMPRPQIPSPPAMPAPEATAVPPAAAQPPAEEGSVTPPATAVATGPVTGPAVDVPVPEPVAATAGEPLTDSPASDELVHIVIADAIRLRKWGREWHELANTIARMAGRPALTEIRRILRTHKADIEAGAPRRPPPLGS